MTTRPAAAAALPATEDSTGETAMMNSPVGNTRRRGRQQKARASRRQNAIPIGGTTWSGVASTGFERNIVSLIGSTPTAEQVNSFIMRTQRELELAKNYQRIMGLDLAGEQSGAGSSAPLPQRAHSRAAGA